MIVNVRKLSEYFGTYFEAENPSPIYGTSSGKVFIVYKRKIDNKKLFVIAELPDFEYDYNCNVCYYNNWRRRMINVDFNQIVPQTITHGSIIFHGPFLYKRFYSEDFLLCSFLNNQHFH